jgi:hypothetical protein
MAALGFLMAPERDVRATTDRDWFETCCAWINGTYMAWRALRDTLPPGERPEGWFDAPNLTTNAADYMERNRPEHKVAFRAHVAERLAQWQARGCDPATVVHNGPAEFCAATGTEPGLGLDKLVAYRGGLLQPIPEKKLKRGGRVGLLANQGDVFAFDTEHERDLLEELTRAAGGDSLALWTWGHTVQVEILRSRRATRPERRRISIRLRRPADRERSAGLRSELERGFDGSALHPDWPAIEAQLAAAEIEIGPWFEAFGLPGAAELAPRDGAALWAELDRAGTDLLRGATPDPAAVKRVNAVLSKSGPEKLPSKPGKGTARRLAGTAWQLRRNVGLPADSGPWPERHRAARLYWTITDSELAEQLTVGRDRQGRGASASLGRLLACYPATSRRDNWLWALAAQQAESANGHAFVPAMEAFAEAAHRAGFTVVLVPAERQAAFRSAFGIEGSAESERGWSAEVFVDLPGLLKVDVADAAGAWLAKSRSSGVVLRCEADGLGHVAAWKDGQPGADASTVLGVATVEAPAEVARALDPRAALRAFGFPLLLGPGEAAAAEAPPAEGAASRRLDPSQFEGWPADVPRRITSVEAAVLVRVDVETRDGAYVDLLATDLEAGPRLAVRRDGSTLHADAGRQLDSADVAVLLGDLPSGSRWAAGGDSGRFRQAF